MIIETKYDIGDIVRYDNDKRGKIIGYDIIHENREDFHKNGIYYEIEAMTYSEQVFLDNYGSMRNEQEISKW